MGGFEEVSLLKVVLPFLVPGLCGLLVFLLGRYTWIFREALSVVGMILTFGLSLYVLLVTQKGTVLISSGNEFRVDALSGLMIFLIALIGLMAVIYSIDYMLHEAKTRRVQEEWMASFYGWTMIFISTMILACTTNNIIMLWVIVEGTTLASAILVAFYWSRESLEAGYKYLMLLTVGISFALFGCVLLYSGASPLIAQGTDPLQITEIAKVAAKIPRTIALLAIAFLLVGFGTKAGMVPFHAWLPDAHAEAPSPISALLSGVMIKVGVYAIIRTVPVFYFYSHISLFVLILGVITMLVGVFMFLLQEDLKRLLAFCSVVNVGLILMGLGLANYLGIYGGIFHILNHGLIKALLFFEAGAIAYATGTRKIGELGGVGPLMPVTGFCFFVGALAMGGIPLLNGFMSEFTLFLAGVEAGQVWATIIAILVSIITLVVFVHVCFSVLMGKRGEKVQEGVEEVPFGMQLGAIVLTLACFLIGIYPQIVHPILDQAARAVLATISTTPLP